MTNDDRDLLDLYIEELRGEPVLTAQQQKELARQMRRGEERTTCVKTRGPS